MRDIIILHLYTTMDFIFTQQFSFLGEFFVVVRGWVGWIKDDYFTAKWRRTEAH